MAVVDPRALQDVGASVVLTADASELGANYSVEEFLTVVFVNLITLHLIYKH